MDKIKVKCKKCKGSGVNRYSVKEFGTEIETCCWCHGNGEISILRKDLVKKETSKKITLEDIRLMDIIEDSLRCPGKIFTHKWVDNDVEVKVGDHNDISKLIYIINQINEKHGQGNKIICEITKTEPYTFTLKI